jgi:serine/threonine-protein kinase
MEQQLHSEPPPLATLRPDTPVAVAEAVGRALRKDPADRYPTAREFAAALGAGVSSVVVPERAAPPSRAGLWLLIAAAVAVLVLIGTLLVRR